MCDIIIPIYNAFDCLAPCINSVIENTDFKRNHLILIDDKSTDEKVLPLLEEYAKKYLNEITLLKNETNLGFVATVNNGMQYSKNDVLLLNSDTEVTNNWLKKIKKCAYSEDNIATVTPLSNNATLASVPKIFQKNDLPNKISLQEMGEIVEKSSSNKYPQIPTGHGFCLYIKRSALNKVGYFDEETFGKGYGEEVDFCFRCYYYGLVNVLCENTYILHKESQSFLNTKTDSTDKLYKKHPNLQNGLSQWCLKPTIDGIGKKIEIALNEKKPNILIVVHDILTGVGGTTLHVLDLIKSLKDKYNFHVFAPDGDKYIIKSFYENDDFITKIIPKNSTINVTNFYSAEYKRIVADILDEYDISLVHVHHLIGHYFDLFDVCLEKKIKYIISLHDFYFIDPVVSKINTITGYSNDHNETDKQLWNNIWKKYFKKSAANIAPSNFSKKEFKKIYKDILISVIEHGVNIKKHPAIKISNSIKNIAFIGAIGEHKGSKILGKITKKGQKHSYRVHLYGLVDKNGHDKCDYIDHGKYHDKEELYRKLKKDNIKIICILSTILESYSYVLTEAISYGIPVITLDISGAVAERVEQNNIGWIIQYNRNEAKIGDEIDLIIKNIEGYNEKIDAINKYKIKKIDQMAQEYSEIYDKNLTKKDSKRQIINPDYRMLKNLQNEKYINEYTERIIKEKQREIDDIKQSTSWKITKPIREIKKMIERKQ